MCAVCGPSGAGKSTLITRLMAEFPEDFGFSVSHTTRKPRAGETDGVNYHFVTMEFMEAEIAKGEFIEYAKVHGKIYGTSKQAVEVVARQNRICILDIDIQGVESCRRLGLDVARYIFVAPPSLEVLEARLRKRATESPEDLAQRLENARSEMAAAEATTWDAWIVNDDLERAYAQFSAVFDEPRRDCALARAHAASAAAPADASSPAGGGGGGGGGGETA